MCVRGNMHTYYKLNDTLRGRQRWSQRAAAYYLLRNSRACLPSPWCWIVCSSGGWLLDHGPVPAFDFAVGPGTFSQSQPSWSYGSASWCSFREHTRVGISVQQRGNSVHAAAAVHCTWGWSCVSESPASLLCCWRVRELTLWADQTDLPFAFTLFLRK